MVLGSPLETTYDVILKLLQIKTRTLLDFLNENKNVIDCSEILASFLCLFPHFPLLFDFGSFSKINPRALFGFLIFPYFNFLVISCSFSLHIFFISWLLFLFLYQIDLFKGCLFIALLFTFFHFLSHYFFHLVFSCTVLSFPLFRLRSSLRFPPFLPLFFFRTIFPLHRPILFSSLLTSPFPLIYSLRLFFHFLLAVSFSLVPRLFTSYSFFLSSSFPPKGDDKRVA